MTLGQSLRRAFLKFPCGHGGSQFTSKGEGSKPIPPSRVYPPQTGPSDAAPAPSVSRTRKTPKIHKDHSESQGATHPRQSNQVNRGIEVQRLSDHNHNSGASRDRSYEHASEPAVGVDNPNLGSQLRDEYQRMSSWTSDYSNHSITHSLRPTTINPRFATQQGVNAEPRESGKPQELAKPHITPQQDVLQQTTSAEQGIKNLPSSEKSVYNGDSRQKHKPMYDERLGTGPSGSSATPLPGDEDYKHPRAPRRVREDWEQKPNSHRRMPQESKHRHEGLCADEIAEGVTSKEQRHAPTTTVQSKPLEAITHTRIRPIEREEVTNVITREMHTIDVHPIIQPIVAQEHLPKKHYLETEPGGQLVEISAEDAEREKWDVVWSGDLVVGRDSGLGLERKVLEKAYPVDEKERSSADRYATATLPLEAPYKPEGVYESYGSGRVMRESAVGYGTTGSEDRIKPLHMPGSFSGNMLVSPTH